MPADEGCSSRETRRMHPDVCGFISEAIYEGRLTATRAAPSRHRVRDRPALAPRRTCRPVDRIAEEATWSPPRSHACSARRGPTSTANAPLTVDDILVVAPYNDQVAAAADRLDADPATRGAGGHGRQVPGSAGSGRILHHDHLEPPRTCRSADFLFSRNRFNVAISRARCLAYLVCTEDLLNSRAADSRRDAADLDSVRVRRVQPGMLSTGPRNRASAYEAESTSPYPQESRVTTSIFAVWCSQLVHSVRTSVSD